MGPDCMLDDIRHTGNQLITEGMSVIIVDALEIVHIYHDNGNIGASRYFLLGILLNCSLI